MDSVFSIKTVCRTFNSVLSCFLPHTSKQSDGEFLTMTVTSKDRNMTVTSIDRNIRK